MAIKRNLLTRIRNRDHSIREFRIAAARRYNEAIDLASAGHRLAAIYLCGYAAEMLLKAAYFRLEGWTSTQAIGMRDLRGAAGKGTPPFDGKLHDLPSWRNLLIAVRRTRGTPYSPRLQRSLNSRVAALALNWDPVMRYYTNQPREAEVRASLDASAWLLNQFPHL
jgi:hypothetical protein